MEHYTHIYFHTEAWRRSYSGVIHPIPSNNLWPQFPKSNLLKPPKVKRQPGRPTTKRRKDPIEKKLTPQRLTKLKVTCSNCGGIGHNSRGCKNETVPKKPKGKPGRPRKKQVPTEAATSGNHEETSGATNAYPREVLAMFYDGDDEQFQSQLTQDR